MFKRLSRGWLSMVIVQAMGSVFMCLTKQNVGSHYKVSSPALTRAHALPLTILCLTRIVLMLNFRNISLHIAHIIISICAVLHTVSEVFFYQSMVYGIVTVTEITFNSFTAVVMISYLFFMEDEPVPKKKREFSAKHYMEGTSLTPDENDVNVQNYKKWK